MTESLTLKKWISASKIEYQKKNNLFMGTSEQRHMVPAKYHCGICQSGALSLIFLQSLFIVSA